MKTKESKIQFKCSNQGDFLHIKYWCIERDGKRYLLPLTPVCPECKRFYIMEGDILVHPNTKEIK